MNTGGHKIYRRQHEKALAKIVDRIAEDLIQTQKDLEADIFKAKQMPESLEKLASLTDLQSRLYQVMRIKRRVRKILVDSQNLLVSTIVPKMDN
jgi:type III secretion system FlhB-like substrate exporter